MSKVRINELGGFPNADPAHELPATLSGSTGKLTVQQIVDLIVDGSPAAMDTLNELSAALGDDANFAATVTTALSERLKRDGSNAMTGDLDLGGNEIVNGTLGEDILQNVAGLNVIKAIHSYETTSAYTRVGVLGVPGVLSDVYTFTPKSDTSSFLIFIDIDMSTRSTSGGNDARATMRPNYYTGAAYADLTARMAGLVNVEPFGAADALVKSGSENYLVLADQTIRRSDTDEVSLRLYGENDYANGEIEVTSSRFVVMEYENG